MPLYQRGNKVNYRLLKSNKTLYMKTLHMKTHRMWLKLCFEANASSQMRHC